MSWRVGLKYATETAATVQDQPNYLLAWEARTALLDVLHRLERLSNQGCGHHSD